MGKKKNSDGDQPTFEQSLEALQAIVHQLEDGELGLTESLERYEDGVKHLKRCFAALEAAERKIALLTGVDQEGNPVTEPFDDAELTLEEKSAQRSNRRSRANAKDPDAACDDAAGDIGAQGGLF